MYIELGEDYGYVADVAVSDLQNLVLWNPTPAGLRNAVLNNRVASIMPNFDPSFMPPQVVATMPTLEHVSRVSEFCCDAITEGRLLDFGVWENRLIKEGSYQNGQRYERSEIPQPFEKPWMFMHSWDGIRENSVSAVYLVIPLEPALPNGCYHVIELLPVKDNGHTNLIVGDRIAIDSIGARSKDPRKFVCHGYPSLWRFSSCAVHGIAFKEALNQAASNVIDPLMCAIAILAMPGVQRQTVAVSEKLQRAVLKSRKPPIPPYEVVDSRPFFAGLSVGF